jgi:hypothetical protein
MGESSKSPYPLPGLDTGEFSSFCTKIKISIFNKNQITFLYKLPIDNTLIMWYNGPPAHGRAGPFFVTNHYTTKNARCQ